MSHLQCGAIGKEGWHDHNRETRPDNRRAAYVYCSFASAFYAIRGGQLTDAASWNQIQSDSSSNGGWGSAAWKRIELRLYVESKTCAYDVWRHKQVNSIENSGT
jgi:hypothetical protein